MKNLKQHITFLFVELNRFIKKNVESVVSLYHVDRNNIQLHQISNVGNLFHCFTKTLQFKIKEYELEYVGI